MSNRRELVTTFTYRGKTVRFDAARRLLWVGDGAPPAAEETPDRPLRILSPAEYREQAGAATTLYILNAGVCNVACTYCDVHMAKHLKPAKMSLETCDEIVAFIHRTLAPQGRSFNVVFFGGEPTLNFPAVRRIVERCRPLREEGLELFFQIPTNVTAVTDEMALFCRENDLYVELSFDGPAAVQNAYRRYPGGGGTYDDVQRGIERLLAHFPQEKLVARPTLTDVSRTGEVFDYFFSRGFRVIQLGMVKKGRPEAFDADDFYGAVDSMMERTVEEISAGRSLVITPIAHYFRELWLFLARGMAVRAVDCGAGVFQLAFGPDGSIYPCAEFAALEEAQAFRLGSCREGLDEALRDAFLEKYSKLRDECGICWGKVLCQGGCKLYNRDGSSARPDCADQGLEVDRLWRAALYWYGHLKSTAPAVLMKMIDADFARGAAGLAMRKETGV